MNINKILAELRAELTSIDEAVLVLERLAGSHTRKGARGRVSGSKRRPFSAETKKRMAVAQRKRWAAYRKAKKDAPES